MNNRISTHVTLITLLMCTGFSIMMPVSAGPLLEAAKEGNGQRTDQIVYRGTDVNAQGPQGDTPLHWAAFQGSTVVTANLIARGADVNARVKDGNTPLHQAAYRGHTEIAEILIRHGAAVNARTQSGITPLDWARRNRHKEVERILIAHGAKPNRVSISKPFGLQQDDVLVTDRVESHQDSAMFASLQALPSVQFIARHRIAAAESPDSITEVLTAPAQTGRFRIQLVAMSSEAGARGMWETYRTRHREVLAGLDLALEPAEVDGRPYYRVQAGPLTRAEAVSTCRTLAQGGQDCVVVNGPPQ